MKKQPKMLAKVTYAQVVVDQIEVHELVLTGKELFLTPNVLGLH